MMDDIGERIKQAISENKQLMDALTACHEKLDGLYIAQDVYLERIRNDKVEIERLCKDLQVFEDGYSCKLGELAESQAREAKLRQAFEVLWIGTDRKTWDGKALEFFKYVFDTEPDDTALKEAIKQAKREALLEAAEKLPGYSCCVELRRMAGELK